jgi:hypothetical protein
MNKSTDDIVAVYTPDNEPYLGRESVYHFDQVILSCMEANSEIAAFTHSHKLSRLQKAACQIIPQGINKEANIKQAQEICNTFNHLVHGDPIGAS